MAATSCCEISVFKTLTRIHGTWFDDTACTALMNGSVTSGHTGVKEKITFTLSWGGRVWPMAGILCLICRREKIATMKRLLKSLIQLLNFRGLKLACDSFNWLLKSLIHLITSFSHPLIDQFIHLIQLLTHSSGWSSIHAFIHFIRQFMRFIGSLTSFIWSINLLIHLIDRITHSLIWLINSFLQIFCVGISVDPAILTSSKHSSDAIGSITSCPAAVGWS